MTTRGQNDHPTTRPPGNPLGEGGEQPTRINKPRMRAGDARRWAPKETTPAGMPLMYSRGRPTRWTDDATARSGLAYRGPAGRAPHHLVAPTYSALRPLLPTAKGMQAHSSRTMCDSP